jgi:heme/copper-type cytochrome/quinol oxidase subunit 4
MNHAVDETQPTHRASNSGPARQPLMLRLVVVLCVVALQVVRIACCALLVLIEPVLRATLVPIAFLGFLVTLVFGFLIGDPRFPRWGMLAFSVGTLMLYWLFLGLMSLFMTLPADHDCR